MMKLLSSPASPFSAKVKMAACYIGAPIEIVSVTTTDDPRVLTDANPLGKIPTLLLDDGTAVFDSRAITRYLGGLDLKPLFPSEASARTRADVMEALCDGICDSLLAIIYEKRMRPEEKVHAPWMDRQWSKVNRGLAYLESNLPTLDDTLDVSHLALFAMLGYLSLRFKGEWEQNYPSLLAWSERFEKAYPELAAFKPHG